MTLDPRLIGRWNTKTNGNDSSPVAIEVDGWNYSLEEISFAISLDGMTLESGHNTFYQRILGAAGPSLVGLWRGTFREIENDVEVVYVEDQTYTDLLMCNSVWTRNGVFLDITVGTYQANGNILSKAEQRGRFVKAEDGNISIHVPYQGDSTATYVFIGNDYFTLYQPDRTVEYTRIS